MPSPADDAAHRASRPATLRKRWPKNAEAPRQGAHRGIAAQRVTILFNHKGATQRASPVGRRRVLSLSMIDRRLPLLRERPESITLSEPRNTAGRNVCAPNAWRRSTADRPHRLASFAFLNNPTPLRASAADRLHQTQVKPHPGQNETSARDAVSAYLGSFKMPLARNKSMNSL